LVAKLSEVDLRHRVGRVALQDVEGIAQAAERPALAADVVVGTDEQIMLGVRKVFVMLDEVVESADLAVVVIAGGGENGDVDPRELLTVGNHALP